LFLPPKWREASVLNQAGIMDQNLTLAHIVHNTSVILLHQGIAYPSPQWRSCPISLPSTSSSETCITAAREIATIAQQYLISNRALTSPQFAFCLFISARMLLAHASYHDTTLPAEFDSLISSLLEIASRWAGQHSIEPENLASRFAKRLVQARNEGLASHQPTLDIRQPAYSGEVDIDMARSLAGDQSQGLNVGASDQIQSPDSMSLAFPPLPLSFQAQALSNGPSRVISAVNDPYSGTAGYDLTLMTTGGALVTSFEGLEEFFADPVFSMQRVSTYRE
jgi:hypothetical protein